ncbi:MAG: DegT/DnrJ/EryC1/StrS family aminotransferase, partial [Nanoarchaeota archaeon]|nr:DegT/DnrJ/EryC1/StrS family aminotransferase [Nanoarchaeota archaeon]
ISYFGFPLVVKDNGKFSRNDFSQYLEKEMIGTRNIFSGNLLKHPAYLKIKHKYKVVGNLENTDRVMNQAMWIGVYPKINLAMIDYIKKTVDKYINQWR